MSFDPERFYAIQKKNAQDDTNKTELCDVTASESDRMPTFDCCVFPPEVIHEGHQVYNPQML